MTSTLWPRLKEKIQIECTGSIPKLYIHLCLLTTFLDFKQGFLNRKNSQEALIILQDLLQASNFSDLTYLNSELTTMIAAENKQVAVQLKEWLQQLIVQIQQWNGEEQKKFHRLVFATMASLFSIESKVFSEVSLYSSFESIDQTLGLDYTLEYLMSAETNIHERIFSGSAESVQSSYSTIFSTLREINPKPGAHLVDLGCGFGRLGLVIGLHRPDMHFTGYEYVDHRVQTAHECSQRMSLSEHIHFVTQDLSDLKFQLPDADIYYLYDPFHAATYQQLILQIEAVSKKRPVVVATKGNAKDWMAPMAQANGWLPTRVLDHGNLNLFQSA